MENFNWKPLAILCSIILAAFLAIVIPIYCLHPSPNNFGDTAGFANGIFSALAFGGVIYAIVLQQKELHLQKIELVETRNVLSQQKKEFEIQNQTLRLDRFENTFFQMLSLHNQIVSNLEMVYVRNELTHNPETGKFLSQRKQYHSKGREIFEDLYYDYPFAPYSTPSIFGIKELIKQKGIEEYENASIIRILDHYFRYLYRILKFIDETDLITGKDDADIHRQKHSYSALLRAQLSTFELVLLHYNSQSSMGKEKFLPLLKKYDMLDNLRTDLLI